MQTENPDVNGVSDLTLTHTIATERYEGMGEKEILKDVSANGTNLVVV